jgi:diaminopimelate decarboxylase
MCRPWDDTFEAMLRGALRLLPADEELRPDLSTATAGLDSLAAVELLIRIEETYDIAVSEELLELDSFATPGALWKLITTVRDAGTSPIGWLPPVTRLRRYSRSVKEEMNTLR